MAERETAVFDEEVDHDDVAADVSFFAQKLGEETSNKFTCYIYRVVSNDETGKKEKKLVKTYTGIEPDPGEIAERFRGGRFYIQFAWKTKKGEKRGRNFTLVIDEDAYPPLPKQTDAQLSGLVPTSGMSDQLILQLNTMRMIADVVKSAYTSNAAAAPTPAAQSQIGFDPFAQLEGMVEGLQSAFSRALGLQQQIMERVYVRDMEKKYKLLPEDTTPETTAAGADENDFAGKYTPIIKQVIEGLKMVREYFGEKLPDKIISKVKDDDRFKALLSDPKALVVVGQALRREFGNEKANNYMRAFGVRMVPKAEVVPTPDIPKPQQAGPKKPTIPAGVVPAQGEKVKQDKKGSSLAKTGKT